MDRTLRTKYDFEFEKVYIRPKREERKKSYLFTVLVVIGLACFFFMPLLAIAKVPLEAWVPVWFGGIALTAVAARISSKRTYTDNMLDCSFIAGFKLTDKQTGEKHPGYVFVEAYPYMNLDVASIRSMEKTEGFKTARGIARENVRIEASVEKKQSENAKKFNEMAHTAEFQKQVTDAILENKDEFEAMKFHFFEECIPGKKRFMGRYYSIPGERGVSKEILISSDCGFDGRLV